MWLYLRSLQEGPCHPDVQTHIGGFKPLQLPFSHNGLHLSGKSTCIDNTAVKVTVLTKKIIFFFNCHSKLPYINNTDYCSQTYITLVWNCHRNQLILITQPLQLPFSQNGLHLSGITIENQFMPITQCLHLPFSLHGLHLYGIVISDSYNGL